MENTSITKNTKQKAIIVVFLAVVLCIVLIAVLFNGCNNASAYQKSIYNDDSLIAKQADSYNFRSRVGSTTNEKSNIAFGSFSGVETIWIIESEGNGSITVEYDVEIKAGKFKGVFINPDDEVVNIFEQSQQDSVTIKTEKGKNRIKIVGNSASGECELTISVSGDAVVKKSV